MMQLFFLSYLLLKLKNEKKQPTNSNLLSYKRFQIKIKTTKNTKFITNLSLSLKNANKIIPPLNAKHKRNLL